MNNFFGLTATSNSGPVANWKNYSLLIIKYSLFFLPSRSEKRNLLGYISHTAQKVPD